jgi:hypothetical protein
MRTMVLGLGLAAIFCVGCGPIQASSAITRADGFLREARTRGWDKECPYEITAADGYLTAARDLAGRAEFDAAREFADKSAQLATSTRDLAPRNARLRESRGKAAPGVPSGKGVLPTDGRSGGPR